MKPCFGILFLLAVAGIAPLLKAADVPSGFAEEVLATNLNAATAMVPMTDGRILIADQTGKLLVWKNGRILERPALTLHVTDYWERGLIGAAMHPDFPRTPYLFLLYVTDRPVVHHVLSRFTFNGDLADPSSEMILFEGDDQSKLGGRLPWGHQGGPLRFGPDRKLYMALGEQTAGMPSQLLDTLQGKILRLNPDGSIPSDNPFYDRATGKYRAIWAYGLRNPFGLAFQPDTGRFFESDVGESSWEEVNEILPGRNYGWPLAEGRSTNTAFQNPIYTYPPVIGRCIVGAAFYPRESTNTAGLFPKPWRGAFFFGDWAANWVKALDPNAPSNVMTFARGLNHPIAVDVAPDHSLLVLNRGTIWRDGKDWRPNTGSLMRFRYSNALESSRGSEETAQGFPATLRATGFFEELVPLKPGNGFVPFEINLPPWQPGVIGRRWIFLPKDGHLAIRADGEFEFPPGAVVVQHYQVEKTGAAFETQVMWLLGSRVARAAAYRWSGSGREPEVIEDGEIVSLPGDAGHQWFSPGAEPRLNLDQIVTGFVLPLNVRQINRQGQLKAWNELGWLTRRFSDEEIRGFPKLASVDDGAVPLERRVRSWLDVNCAACHRPGGPSRGNFDARFSTPFPDKRIINGELLAGDLGIAGAKVVVPGRPDQSVMLQRVKRHDAFRMPPVSVNDDRSPFVPLLESWIGSLPSAGKSDRALSPSR